MQNTKEIRDVIIRELPKVIEDDKELQQLIIRLSRQYFADKEHTEDKFDRILGELKADRERQDKKWEEQNKKWEEQNKKWEEQNKKWEEQNKKWEDHNKKWEANQKVINEMLADIKALSRKHDSTIVAIGARWDLHTEQAFRNALKSILEEFPGVEVYNITEFDETGQVFGRPEQVEIDLIVKNGVVIIAEIKSSVSKAEIYVLERKARFYEELHNRQISRIMIISPMVEKKAWPVAQKLGIEVYNSADEAQI